MSTNSPIEEIKKYPVLALVPIAGVCWFLLSKYSGSVVVIRTDLLSSTLNLEQISGIDLEALRICKQNGLI
jgi:hypothetical protein